MSLDNRLPPQVRRQRELQIDETESTIVDRTLGSRGYPQTYLAYSAGRIKIGTSLFPKGRGRGLSTQSPHPVTILFARAGGRELENDLHEMLDCDRVHGEWFRLTEGMRELLHEVLCKQGLRKFKKAEREFRRWLVEEGYISSG